MRTHSSVPNPGERLASLERRGSQGDILHHDGKHFIALPAGTDQQALITQGAAANPVWANGWRELAEGSTTASSLDIFFTPADWIVIKFFLFDVKAASGNNAFLIRTSSDGASFDNGGADYKSSWIQSDGGAAPTGGGGTGTSISLDVDASSGGNDWLSAEVTLFRPVGTRHTHLAFHVTNNDSGDEIRATIGGGVRQSAADVDGIQFLFAVDITVRFKVIGFQE